MRTLDELGWAFGDIVIDDHDAALIVICDRPDGYWPPKGDSIPFWGIVLIPATKRLQVGDAYRAQSGNWRLRRASD